jgi:hypothetical protein
VRAFLQAPYDRGCFNTFFNEYLRQTIYCLNSLRARGYRLPVGETNAASLRDLAYDILGSLLRTERGGKPYHVVMDYFNGKGILDLSGATDETLCNLMMGLLWSYTRQELFRITAQADPQKAKLKRRLGDVLDGTSYKTETMSGSPTEYVYLVANRDDLRPGCPMLSYDGLQRLAESAYLKTCTFSQCCAGIFVELGTMIEVQNCLRRHELVSAVVSVVLRYLNTDGFQTPAQTTPEGDFDAGTMNRARGETIGWLIEAVIGEFVEKGRITQEVGGHFALAADQYLIDLSTHGNNDPIPQYFREMMPECEHGRYLATYKYVFETVINQAVEEFRKRLRE